MKLFAMIFAFIVAALFKSTSVKPVLGLETSSETPTVTISPTDTVIPTITLKPTAKPGSGTTSVSINSNVHIVNNGTGENGKVKIIVTGADWQYPGSADDSAAVVTDWYVAKIKSSGMSTTSFVKTNANDHVLNCLVARDIKIQISQNSDANCQW